MGQSVSVEALETALAEAVRAAALQAAKASRDPVVGFALATDDEVATLFHVFATRSWVEARAADDPEIGFLFVEWEQSADDGLFGTSGELLRTLAAADDSRPAAEARFRALVASLRTARREGWFGAEVLLYVGSTDPDEAAESWARDAARHLNSPEIFQALCEAMGWTPG